MKGEGEVRREKGIGRWGRGRDKGKGRCDGWEQAAKMIGDDCGVGWGTPTVRNSLLTPFMNERQSFCVFIRN